jgi:hypothetical protein
MSALRLGLGLLVAALLWIGGRALVDALASDESKIRGRIETACEGFGNTRMDPVLELLARDFQDETSGFDRSDVREGVAAIFFQAKDPATKGFPYRARLVPDSLDIAVEAAEPPRARVRFTVEVLDTRGGNERIAWSAAIDGAFVEGEDGWQMRRSTHTTTQGNWRLR